MNPRRSAARRVVDWDALADGRVWRLTRGRHYEGDDRMVVDAARAAADRRGNVVRIARENFGRTAGYVWVQFADAEIAYGSPCPRCGSTTLTRNHPTSATCPRCDARLVLKLDADAAGAVFDEDDPAVPADEDDLEPALPRAAEVAHAPAPEPEPLPRVERQRPQIRFVPEAPGSARLESYEEVRLKVDSHAAEQSSFYGFGRARGVKPAFLYVEFFPADESEELGDHRVTAIVVRPYAEAVDLLLLSRWPRFEIRPLSAADRDELTPVHPYYSVNRSTGVCVIPVAEDAKAVAAPPHPSGSSGTP